MTPNSTDSSSDKAHPFNHTNMYRGDNAKLCNDCLLTESHPIHATDPVDNTEHRANASPVESKLKEASSSGLDTTPDQEIDILIHDITSQPMTSLAIRSRIDRLITKQCNLARIGELKQLEPPEQYEEYAKLMEGDTCTICGFNAIKFREYIRVRVAELKRLEGKTDES